MAASVIALLLFITLLICTVLAYVMFFKAGKDSYKDASQIPFTEDDLDKGLDKSEEKNQ